MSPADITAAAEFRAGLARRLAELGLVAARARGRSASPRSPMRRPSRRART